MVSEFAGPISMAIGKQDAAARAEIRDEIESCAGAFRDGNGYTLPGLTLVFTATT